MVAQKNCRVNKTYAKIVVKSTKLCYTVLRHGKDSARQRKFATKEIIMIAIITDSSSNITQSEGKQLGITVMPLTIIFGADEYRDGVDIDEAKFYQKLTTEKSFPHTAQLTMEQIETAVADALTKADEVLLMPISSALSGSYERCVTVANKYDNVYAFDGKATTIMLKMLVLKAVQNVDKSAKELIQILTDYRKRIKLFAALDTLEYLGKGGRISKTTATIGNLLKVKPVIIINDKGEVEVVSKQHGIIKGMNYIVEQFVHDDVDYDEPLHILYSMTRDNSNKLVEKLGIGEHIASEICPVIGAHVGPNLAGVVYVRKEK